MADESTVETQNNTTETTAAPEGSAAPVKKATRKRVAKKASEARSAADEATESSGGDERGATRARRASAAAPEAAADVSSTADSGEEGPAPVKKAAPRKRASKKAAAAESAADVTPAAETGEEPVAPAKKATTRKTAAKRTTKKADEARSAADGATESSGSDERGATRAKRGSAAAAPAAAEAQQETLLDVPADAAGPEAAAETPAPAKKTTRKRATKKVAAAEPGADTAQEVTPEGTTEQGVTQAKRASTTRKRTTKKAAAAPVEATADAQAAAEQTEPDQTPTEESAATAPGVLFQAPEKTPRKRAPRKAKPVEEPAAETSAEDEEALEAAAAVAADAAGDSAAAGETSVEGDESADEGDESGTPARRRRRRGGRRRRKSGESNGADNEASDSDDEDADQAEDQAEDQDAEEQSEGGSSRRRRRRRRAGESGGNSEEDVDNPPNTVTKVRDSRPLEQQITAVSGSTRLEAKKQRRREGREAGRRRAPIVSEAEFLARRESVERVMVIRQRDDLTQIGVLEDKVLVEHYVARESQTSLIGNIYLGRVQNVLPSMEAAFVDIGKGRNAVLYAGEVNWSALGWKEGQPRKIESVLSSGQTVLVQVTKDPIGHKGARLTSQISLAGRFLVYVPDGTTSGISRKLPDTERNRLKSLLKEIVPDSAGVIVRTAAEGASEEELTRDVERLKARWEDIEAKAANKGANAQLLYGEPDLTLKVVRDLFTEDFVKLVIQGQDAWDTVKGYVDHVAPDLGERLERFVPGEDGKDAFLTYRIDEQIAKGLDRKVWLPSGGSLIIDRTEAMTVVDVNTGKFTGSGGNLEETVTKNNLEAAEEIVRQLRLRDIGGIIVVDFIDMVLESNRDLVLRRLVECLGRDRTRHQVAEVTSLGLVQMTRKRIGTGLLEAFSETCTHCHGRGLIVHDHPVEEGRSSGVAPDEPRRSRRRGGKGKSNGNDSGGNAGRGEDQQADEPAAEDPHHTPTPAEFAAMARHQEDEERAAAEAAAAAEAPEVQASDVVEAAEPAEAVVLEEFDDASAEKAAEPEAPTVRVVTRTRRRGASRPAGVTDGASVAPVVVTPQPVAVPAQEAATPEPPKVITRTRRGASRSVTTPEPSAAPEAASGDAGEGSEEQSVEHVPVKKKGTRKR